MYYVHVYALTVSNAGRLDLHVTHKPREDM